MKKSEKEIEELRHKNKMLELETEKNYHIEIEKFKFERAKEIQRIKSADIRRNIR